MSKKTKDLKIDVYKTVIKKDGIIDLKALYENVNEIAKSYGYEVLEKEQKKEKDEISLVWKLEKKLDPYFKSNIEIELKSVKCFEVSVERKGKKEKKFKGETIIQYTAVLNKNYKKDFGDTKFQNFLRRSYEEISRMPDLERYEKELTVESINIAKRIKDTLEQF